MKTIKIEIDCGEKTCGKCSHLQEIDLGEDYCELFLVDDCECTKLDYDKNMFPLRCPVCLDAEEDER